ncbi:MAG: hypothetical protein AAFR23_08005 [Pseudomonadota bacterium]
MRSDSGERWAHVRLKYGIRITVEVEQTINVSICSFIVLDMIKPGWKVNKIDDGLVCTSRWAAAFG